MNPPRWADLPQRVPATIIMCPHCSAPIQRTTSGQLVDGLTLHLQRIHSMPAATARDVAGRALRPI